jgi:hypothetical protein
MAAVHNLVFGLAPGKPYAANSASVGAANQAGTLGFPVSAPGNIALIQIGGTLPVAYNPVCRWQKSPSTNVNQYLVKWTYTPATPGAPAQTQQVAVAQSAAGDTSGYSTTFSVPFPTATLQPGDSISVGVDANDTVNNLFSAVVSAGPLVIPPAAPLPPVNVSLGLT